MDFSGLQSRVLEQLEDRTDLSTKIQNWINDTRKDLALEYDFDYLYVEATCLTSAGTAVYALPADFLNLEDIWCGTKKLMRTYTRERDELTGTHVAAEYIAYKLAIEQGLDANFQGPPDYYTIRGQELEFFPIPDGSYTLLLKYYAQPADFSFDVDSDHISQFHFDAIIWGAALRGAMYLDDDAKVGKFEPKYQAAVQKMIAREKRKAHRDQKPRFKDYKDYDLATFMRLHKIYTPMDN